MTKSNAARRKQITVKKTVVRKKAHGYKEAVHDIRNMFLEQAALWKDQADRLEEAAGTSETLLFQQEPWSSHVDAKQRRPARVFGEGKVENDEMKKVNEIKGRLEKSRKWRYKRPLEQSDDDAEENSEESEEEDAKQT